MNGGFDRYLETTLKNWASSVQPPADGRTDVLIRARLLRLAAAQASPPKKHSIHITSMIVALLRLLFAQPQILAYNHCSSRSMIAYRNDWQRACGDKPYLVFFPMPSNLRLIT